jgi:Flp pilus assembly protein TadD
VGQASYAAVYYLLKTMLPLGLHALHPLPAHLSLSDPLFLGALVSTILLSAVVIACARPWPGMLTVWFSYLAILAPSSGLIAFGNQLVADRYSYLASVAWSIAAGYWWVRMMDTHRRLVLGLSLVVIVCLSGLSRRQCLTWRDSTSLWTNVLAWDDSSSAAHLNLGNLLSYEGRRREARHHYLAAAKHDPASPDPYFNSAVLLAQEGRLDEAQKYLAEALKRGLPSHDGMSWLALVLSDNARSSEALPLSERAVREAPDSARIQHTHATVLWRLGRLEEAITCFSRAIALDPSMEAPRLSMGLVLADLGRFAQAEEVLRDLLRHDPASVPAHVCLGELLARRGDRAGASQHFRQALLLKPGFPRAADGLRTLGEDGKTGR